jgi:hypothetical protein
MVFVKTVVYHALGTLMPYPSEDPPRLLEISLPERRLFMLLVFNALVFTPVGREASIASRSGIHAFLGHGLRVEPAMTLSEQCCG